LVPLKICSLGSSWRPSFETWIIHGLQQSLGRTFVSMRRQISWYLKRFVNHQMIKDVFAKLDYHCIWLPSLFILLNWCGSIFQVASFLGGFEYILCLNKWDDYRTVDHPAECRKWSNEKRFGWKPSETNSTKTNRLPCAVKRWNVSGEYGSSLQWHRNSSLQRSFKGDPNVHRERRRRKAGREKVTTTLGRRVDNVGKEVDNVGQEVQGMRWSLLWTLEASKCIYLKVHGETELYGTATMVNIPDVSKSMWR